MPHLVHLISTKGALCLCSHVYIYIPKGVRLLFLASEASESMSAAERCDVTQNTNRRQIVSKPCVQLPFANRMLPFSLPADSVSIF